MQDQHDPRIGEGRGGGASEADGSDAVDGGGGGATVLSLAQGLGLEFVPLSSLQFLDAPDIARCGAANRFLYKAAEDEGVWQAARDRLWEGKVFVPESSRTMRAKEGYIASLRDSTRTWLLPEELTSFSWWFRFKQQAGEAWTAQDPWYRNEKAPTVDFKLDHTVLRHGDMSLPPAASINWRFVERTGRRTGPKGSFLRVSIGGREVPTYIVSRHPSNWGFLLESCWTVYTSWEMPPRDGPGCDRSLLDDELTVTMDDQWEEAMSFNTGLSFEIYDQAPLAGGNGDGDGGGGDPNEDAGDDDAGSNDVDDIATDQEVEMQDVVVQPPAAHLSQQQQQQQQHQADDSAQNPQQEVQLGAAAAVAVAVAAASGAKAPSAAAGFSSGGSGPANGKQSSALAVKTSSVLSGGGGSSNAGGAGAGAVGGAGFPPATREGSE